MPPFLGPVRHVAIVNRSRGRYPDAVLAVVVEAYRAALPAFCEAWSLPVPGIALYPSDHRQEPSEEAALFLVDSANDPDTFGAHTHIGAAAWGYVDCALSSALDEPVDRVLGHELFELLADPGLDRWVNDYAVEVCDPVQRLSVPARADFLGTEGVVQVADYVLPGFYAPGSSGPWDRDGAITGPLTVAPGGYMSKREAGARVTVGDGARVTSFGRTIRRLLR